MPLTEARRQTLTAYCRLDELEAGEESLLASMYDAAVAYMTQAGVAEPPDGTPRRGQYDLLVNALVLDSWDRRDLTIAGTITTDNPALRRMLDQLKLTEPVPESGTGED